MIYLDNAATTTVCKKAKDAMEPYFTDRFYNPSAAYKSGREAKKVIENCRKKISFLINAAPENIIFTSGGTEADNMAIRNIGRYKTSHVITSKIEHHAVLDTCKYIESEGADISYLDVDRDGVINVSQIEKEIRHNTKLITVMFANNEIGTIEPVTKIGNIARAYQIPFHTDAVQAFGHVPINVERMNIDMLSVSAHKFMGPKGVGFLYVRNVDRMNTFLYGGGQESGIRSGTENVAGIVGMEAAATHAIRTMMSRRNKEQHMRNYLVDRITREIPETIYNGSRFNRLPGNANFSFRNVSATALVEMMSDAGICISAGSACQAAGGKPSHVIRALEIPEAYAYGTVRITLSAENTMEEIDKTIVRLKEFVTKMRSD